MRCPRCHKTLIILERHKIELDYCLDCKGLWFDHEEWNFLPEALGLDFQLPDFNSYPTIQASQKPLRCPRCLARMNAIDLNRAGANHAKKIGAIIVDSCPDGHGVWFDAGELAGVIEGLNHTKDTPSNRMISFLGEFINIKE